MSLAAASEARKERLLALRRKRAGEDVQDTRYVNASFFFSLELKMFDPDLKRRCQPAPLDQSKFQPRNAHVAQAPNQRGYGGYPRV